MHRNRPDRFPGQFSARFPVAQNEILRCVESAIEIDGGDHRLGHIAENRFLAATARLTFAGPKPEHRAEVEVTGQRAGFNGLICKQVWPAGTAQPRRIQLPIERLFVGGFVIYGLLATLAGLAGQL